MNAYKINLQIENDGEIYIKGLPLRQNDRVEVIILNSMDEVADEELRIGLPVHNLGSQNDLSRNQVYGDER